MPTLVFQREPEIVRHLFYPLTDHGSSFMIEDLTRSRSRFLESQQDKQLLARAESSMTVVLAESAETFKKLLAHPSPETLCTHFGPFLVSHLRAALTDIPIPQQSTSLLIEALLKKVTTWETVLVASGTSQKELEVLVSRAKQAFIPGDNAGRPSNASFLSAEDPTGQPAVGQEEHLRRKSDFIPQATPKTKRPSAPKMGGGTAKLLAPPAKIKVEKPKVPEEPCQSANAPASVAPTPSDHSTLAGDGSGSECPSSLQGDDGVVGRIASQSSYQSQDTSGGDVPMPGSMTAWDEAAVGNIASLTSYSSSEAPVTIAVSMPGSQSHVVNSHGPIAGPMRSDTPLGSKQSAASKKKTDEKSPKVRPAGKSLAKMLVIPKSPAAANRTASPAPKAKPKEKLKQHEDKPNS